jgi:hypothetical protein
VSSTPGAPTDHKLGSRRSCYVSPVLFIAMVVIILALLTGLVAFLGRVLYLRQVRRSLLRLITAREAVRAAERGLQQVLQHLVEADNEAFGAFAADPASEDRRALEELAGRMRITADELKALALPKRLWGVAERIESAARAVADQAGGVGEATGQDAVLERLAAIRLQDVHELMASADESLDPVLEAYKVREPSVYGGGLYI